MATAQAIRSAKVIGDRPARGKWAGGPELPQTCPGCGSPLVLIQPDEGNPAELLSCCAGEACREWGIYHRPAAGRPVLVERIPRQRRDPRTAASAARPTAAITNRPMAAAARR
jgi:hypothetical protein